MLLLFYFFIFFWIFVTNIFHESLCFFCQWKIKILLFSVLPSSDIVPYIITSPYVLFELESLCYSIDAAAAFFIALRKKLYMLSFLFSSSDHIHASSTSPVFLSARTQHWTHAAGEGRDTHVVSRSRCFCGSCVNLARDMLNLVSQPTTPDGWHRLRHCYWHRCCRCCWCRHRRCCWCCWSYKFVLAFSFDFMYLYFMSKYTFSFIDNVWIEEDPISLDSILLDD